MVSGADIALGGAGVLGDADGEQPANDMEVRTAVMYIALLIVVKKVCILNLWFRLRCYKQDTVFHALVSSRSYP